ncbi:hypothetical protein M878_16335 [Streptomyces roseochromogenus subsp. oscitans DS 12.976]|uniref:Uncharacterized protein n=1 Tax=Streptomyces roseochromogenus subsp. oscitans DS 12.976 TaxID=1352936 RepID=V6KJI0_STRRC|nr:hypothetical protein M878_16335 [Streptomyces roseochromogenus subsp. oscitans DS 12.976]
MVVGEAGGGAEFTQPGEEAFGVAVEPFVRGEDQAFGS